MFSVQFDAPAQLLTVRLAQDVSVEEMAACRAQVDACLADAKPGFKLLSDLSMLRWMDVACAHEIGVLMDLLQARKVGLVVRVISDPHKDIGFNILSRFHYGPDVRFIVCQDLASARQQLAI